MNERIIKIIMMNEIRYYNRQEKTPSVITMAAMASRRHHHSRYFPSSIGTFQMCDLLSFSVNGFYLLFILISDLTRPY